jgi:hypothetical protein
MLKKMAIAIGILCLLPILFAAPALAQVDPGIADTVRLESKNLPLATTKFSVAVNLYNDEELGAFDIPLAWNSPDLSVDSVSFVGSRFSGYSTKLYEKDNVNQRLHAGIIVVTEAYMQPGSGLIFTVFFSVKSGALDQVISVDSAFYPPASDPSTMLTLTDASLFPPRFIKGTERLGNPATSPVIVANPTSFTFTGQQGGANPVSQTLNISNSGPGTLNWTVTSNHTWLHLNPGSGTGNGSTSVSADLTGLTANTYRDTIVIADPNASNTPVLVPVTFTVTAPPPTIVLTPASAGKILPQGLTPAYDTVQITNSGGGTLHWTATKKAAWLTINPTSGTGNGPLVISYPGVAALSVGNYYDTVVVADPSATNTPVRFPISIQITPAPCYTVSPNQLNFAGYPGATLHKSVAIANCGSSPINWTVSGVNAPWLSVLPLSGTDNGTLDFAANLTGLAPGNYYDTVQVAGAGAMNSPQSVLVTLAVVPASSHDTVSVATVTSGTGKQVSVDIRYANFTTTSAISLPLHFGGTDITCDSISFVGSRFSGYDIHEATIDNSGRTIYIKAVPLTTQFLTGGTGLLAKAFFTIATSAPNQLAAIDSGFIAPTGDFAFSDENGGTKRTEFVAGAINVQKQPCFEFPTDRIVFNGYLGEAVAPQMFTITNSCGPGLKWHVTSDSPWLSVTPDSGGAGVQVTFAVNTTGLAESEYTGIVTFSSNAVGSPFEVIVTLILQGRPNMMISSIFEDFGHVCKGDTLTGYFLIANAGAGKLNWTSQAGDMVELDPSSGTASTQVTFKINTALLDTGVQNVSIVITGENALNSPKTFVARAYVVDCKACSFDIAEVEAAQGQPIGVPIYAHDIHDVAGLQFHLAFDSAMLRPDSITSNYMTGPTFGLFPQQITYVWDNLAHPITVPNGQPIMTLWFTAKGPSGQVTCVNWIGDNELSDPLGNIIYGIGYCNGCITIIQPYFMISGRVIYYDLSRPVKDATVDLQGTASTQTDQVGLYSFVDMVPGPYQLTVSRTADDPGTSVADVIKIRRHIALVEPFDSPYKMIAADVNQDTRVSVADVVLIRRYITLLGALPSGNWTFIDSSYAINMNNWYFAQKELNLALGHHDLVAATMVGIRMGDVNNTWSQQKLFAKANATVASLQVADTYGRPGDMVTIPVILSSAEEMAGLELHLTYDQRAMTFVGASSELLKDMTINGAGGAVHLVWEDFTAPRSISGTQTVVNLNFKVNSVFSGIAEIGIGDAEIADASGATYMLERIGGSLQYGTPRTLPTAYTLEQNSPNPFNPTTTIRATMKEAGAYSLAIYNVMGQKIRDYSGQGEAGVLEFVWDGRNDAGEPVASGIYLYRFAAGPFAQTKKMMLVK